MAGSVLFGLSMPSASTVRVLPPTVTTSLGADTRGTVLLDDAVMTLLASDSCTAAYSGRRAGRHKMSVATWHYCQKLFRIDSVPLAMICPDMSVESSYMPLNGVVIHRAIR